MSKPTLFHDGRVALFAGDCLDVLDDMPENSIDSVVTDAPYHLTSVVKQFGKKGSAPAQFGTDGAYARASRGFMGKTWDGGDIAFRPETWAKVMRVLKPGGYLVAFGGTRTYHRVACAIEDAGFEIRDALMWHYGQGFPKSRDISKDIDKAAGAQREKIAIGAPVKRMIPGADQSKSDGSWIKDNGREYQPGIQLPVTEAAKQWGGWGTALKPATEIIALARKPLSERTVAANVLRWGVGALNIDACRILSGDDLTRECRGMASSVNEGWRRPWMENAEKKVFGSTLGRWPANVCHSGEDEVVAMFPNAGGGFGQRGGSRKSEYGFGGTMETVGYGNSGSAARFFYCAKASAKDRCGSKHPTVKPIALMQWLVRLVTPPGGTVLDCFAGSGTTAHAALLEGFSAVLVEREDEYLADIEQRMGLVFDDVKEQKPRHLDAPEIQIEERLAGLFLEVAGRFVNVWRERRKETK